MIMYMLIAAMLLVALLMHLLFVYAWYTQDNSIIDPWWGVGFALIALLTILMGGNYGQRQLLITGMTLVWALRISIHLFLRRRGKPEDPRYAKWRKQWGNSVVWRSYMQVFMLQGLVMLLVALPIIITNAAPPLVLSVVSIVGFIIWLLAIVVEATADYQLERFLKDKAHKGQIMQQGLWAYSRHPNYVGEALIWWGMFCVAVQVPYGLISLISPVLITLLLRYVSGVPLAEEQMRNVPGYDAYAQVTPIFFPRLWK